MKLHFKQTLPFFLILSLLSCGRAPDPKGSSQGAITEAILPDGSNIEGFYIANLSPVNLNLHFMKVGSAGFERTGDIFNAKVIFNFGVKGAWHPQGIYSGTRCPNINDDTNGDAFIDITEAQAILGKMLIPLDGSLESHEEGKNLYPTGNKEKGSFVYEQTASFSRMFSDLKTNKLKDNEGLSLVGKIVLIQGATRETVLPDTALGTLGMSAHTALPVACGVIMKVPEMPEELNHGSGSGIGTVTPARNPNPEPNRPEPIPTPIPAPVNNSEESDRLPTRIEDSRPAPGNNTGGTTRSSRSTRRWYERVGEWVRDRVEDI
jgi:hypothetical protein